MSFCSTTACRLAAVISVVVMRQLYPRGYLTCNLPSPKMAESCTSLWCNPQPLISLPGDYGRRLAQPLPTAGFRAPEVSLRSPHLPGSWSPSTSTVDTKPGKLAGMGDPGRPTACRPYRWRGCCGIRTCVLGATVWLFGNCRHPAGNLSAETRRNPRAGSPLRATGRNNHWLNGPRGHRPNGHCSFGRGLDAHGQALRACRKRNPRFLCLPEPSGEYARSTWS